MRLFDDYVNLMMGLPAGTCASNGRCGAYLVVEADGGVYPCDFFVLDDWKLGNLNDTPLELLAESSRAERFLQDGIQHPNECEACRWKHLCNGGCKRDWQEGPEGNQNNYYCAAFKKFFLYAEARLRHIASVEMAARGNSMNYGMM